MEVHDAIAALVHAELARCYDEYGVLDVSDMCGAADGAADEEALFDVFDCEAGEGLGLGLRCCLRGAAGGGSGWDGHVDDAVT